MRDAMTHSSGRGDVSLLSDPHMDDSVQIRVFGDTQDSESMARASNMKRGASNQSQSDGNLSVFGQKNLASISEGDDFQSEKNDQDGNDSATGAAWDMCGAYGDYDFMGMDSSEYSHSTMNDTNTHTLSTGSQLDGMFSVDDDQSKETSKINNTTK